MRTFKRTRMKKTITLLFGLFFGLNLFGQYVNYETDSRWFLNANVGGTWQTTDVENKTYAGWGLILGKSFNSVSYTHLRAHET